MPMKSIEAAHQENPGKEELPTTAKSHPHSPQRILVVDDDENIRRLFFEVLIRSGYQVDTAADGEVGWNVLNAARHDPASYDLLITDNNMPRLSGVELVKKLRSEYINLPIILASSAVPIDTGDLHLAAILPKPLFPAQLVQTVKDVLHATHPSDTTAERLGT